MSLKIAVRDLLSCSLNLAPIKFLISIRDAYHKASVGSLQYKILSLLMYAIKYRKTDSSIEVFSLADSPGLYFVNDNSFTSQRIFWYGRRGFHRSEIKWWMRLCKSSRGILEMGANIGYFTIHGASVAPEVPYVAVEPNPDSACSLKKNIAINKIDNVRVVEAAVVGRKISETMQLLIPDIDTYYAPAGAYIVGAETKDTPARKSINVRVVEAKDIFIENIDLLKLDIEGMEFAVLDSILPDIRKTIPTIFLEVLRNTSKLRKLLAQLSVECGYKIYALGSDELYPVSPNEIFSIVLEDKFNTRDVVLVPYNKHVV